MFVLWACAWNKTGLDTNNNTTDYNVKLQNRFVIGFELTSVHLVLFISTIILYIYDISSSSAH